MKTGSPESISPLGSPEEEPTLTEPSPSDEGVETEEIEKTVETSRASDPEKTPWIRDNVEAFTIAIVMALVLRHFCIEAFKIPTPSMEPTLIGREHNGDRILVNKFIYKFTDPSRWDVVVFKYPLNITKNYIKRLVGLPGEALEIRDGDIFIDGKISRKPDHVQKTLWKNWPYYQWLDGGERFLIEWNTLPSEKGRWELRDGHVHVSAPEEPSWVELDREITDSYRHYNQHFTRPVGDVRLALSVTPEPGMKSLSVSLRSHSESVVLTFGVRGAEGGIRLTRKGETVYSEPTRKLEPGVETTLVLSDVDDTLHLEVDGELHLRSEYEGPFQGEERPRGFDRSAFHVRLGVDGGSAQIRDVAVSRDIYYTFEARDTWNQNPGNGEFPTWKIPEDHFFCLGDNSPQSKDCRYWGMVRRTLQGGREIFGDASPRVEEAENGDDPNAFVDTNGEAYTLAEMEHRMFSSEDLPRPVPFVHRRLLMGQAFFIFWPPYRHRNDLDAYLQTGMAGDSRLQLNSRFVR